MEIIKVPDATASQPQIKAGDIIFVDYKDRGGQFRNRVFFDCCAFSFVQNGQKHIYRAGGNTVLSKGQGMLVPQGKSLITEHSDNQERYHSVIVFFPGRIGREFMASHPCQGKTNAVQAPYINFEINAYIHEYVRHIRALIARGDTLSPAMATLKVEELLMALYELAPSLLQDVFDAHSNYVLKNIVENNLLNTLALEEMAFLSNRSLSSFKRDFQKEYGLPPQKYIRERRLEMARAELSRGRIASELYLEYGYSHLTAFVAAFKRKYGVSPAAFQRS